MENENERKLITTEETSLEIGEDHQRAGVERRLHELYISSGISEKRTLVRGDCTNWTFLA